MQNGEVDLTSAWSTRAQTAISAGAPVELVWNGGLYNIDGTDQIFAPVNKRGLGVVFQNYALFAHMSVAENVSFPLKMRGQSAAEITQIEIKRIHREIGATILKGRVAGECLQTALGPVPHGQAGLADNTAGALVIRPEDIRLHEGAFEGRVVETVFAGSDLRVILDAQGCEVTTRASASFDPVIGDTVRFGWAEAAQRYVPDDSADG